MLDDTVTRPGYLCGRLFSVLVDLEAEAVGTTELRDSKMAPAVQRPTMVLKLAATRQGPWLTKLRTQGRAGTADRLADQIASLAGRVDPAVKTLGHSEEQSLFILGYHHQRAADMDCATTAEAAELLGLSSSAAARVQLARWGIKSVGRAGDGQNRWPKAEIVAAKERRPGRGARTDLAKD
jgi:CRISPR-associated protein Csd1